MATARILDFFATRRPEGPCLVVDLDVVRDNYLRFNRATNTYSGSVSVASSDAAAARLTSIELRDDAGNTRTFDLN